MARPVSGPAERELYRPASWAGRICRPLDSILELREPALSADSGRELASLALFSPADRKGRPAESSKESCSWGPWGRAASAAALEPASTADRTDHRAIRISAPVEFSLAPSVPQVPESRGSALWEQQARLA